MVPREELCALVAIGEIELNLSSILGVWLKAIEFGSGSYEKRG